MKTPLPKNFKGIDLTGQKFGKRRVLGYAGKDSGGKTLWYCLCHCGVKKVMLGMQLRVKNPTQCKSCSNKYNPNGLTHGHSAGGRLSKTYLSWRGAKARCFNENTKTYHYYGGRGITMCARWADPELGFQNFLADMGERPEGHTIDRINNDGNYEPGNCRWATPSQQNSNRGPRQKKPRRSKANGP